MKKLFIILLAGLFSNDLLMAQSDSIFPKLKYRTWVIPYENKPHPMLHEPFKKQPHPMLHEPYKKQPVSVLYEVKDSSVMVTLTTSKNRYNKGKYTLSKLNIKEIYEIKYCKKYNGYSVLIGGATGLAVGLAFSIPLGINYNGWPAFAGAVGAFFSTGIGTAIGAIIKGRKTTILLQGNQTKYDLYKNRLNELAVLENQLPLVKDTNGNKYTTGCFCGKEWMRENLKVTRYRNGDNIPKVKDAATWKNIKTGALCWYNNDSKDTNSQGLLYNRGAIDDPRGLCPDGWHVPSYQEWSALVSCLGNVIPDRPGPSRVKPVKTDTTNLILLQDQDAFSVLAGFREKTGTFSADLSYSQWWTSTSRDSTMTKAIILQFTTNMIFFVDFDRNTGLSVRCVRDR